MTSNEEMKGGCLCGAIRYCVPGTPFATEYCHCRMCQKSVGGMAVCWMDFRKDQLKWTAGEPAEFASSETARRGFCSACGSSLTFRDTQYPEYITLTIASLDDPNPIVPERHIYSESKVRWLNIEDDCKRFPRGPEKNPV